MVLLLFLIFTCVFTFNLLLQIDSFLLSGIGVGRPGAWKWPVLVKIPFQYLGSNGTVRRLIIDMTRTLAVGA